MLKILIIWIAVSIPISLLIAKFFAFDDNPREEEKDKLLIKKGKLFYK